MDDGYVTNYEELGYAVVRGVFAAEEVRELTGFLPFGAQLRDASLTVLLEQWSEVLFRGRREEVPIESSSLERLTVASHHIGCIPLGIERQ